MTHFSRKAAIEYMVGKAWPGLPTSPRPGDLVEVPVPPQGWSWNRGSGGFGAYELVRIGASPVLISDRIWESKVQRYAQTLTPPQQQPLPDVAAWVPDVGTECEFAHAIAPNNWHKCIFFGESRFQAGCFMVESVTAGPMYVGESTLFRPLKTERQAFIEQAGTASNIGPGSGRDEVLGDLYDAGCRFVDQTAEGE